MYVIHREYTTKGEHKSEVTLSSIFEHEISKDQDPTERSAELLSNLASLLVKKGLVSLEEISSDVLELEQCNPDFPALSLPRKKG
jgi:hypothetical protein